MPVLLGLGLGCNIEPDVKRVVKLATVWVGHLRVQIHEWSHHSPPLNQNGSHAIWRSDVFRTEVESGKL